MSGKTNEHDPVAIAWRALESWKTVSWDRDEAADLDLRPTARAVAALVHRIHTANDAAEVIAAELRAAFPHRRDSFNHYTCASVAARVYRDLRAADLLDGCDRATYEDEVGTS